MKKYLLITALSFAFLFNAQAQKNSFSIGTDAIVIANIDEEAGLYSGITLGLEPALNNYFTAHVHATMRTEDVVGTNIFNLRSRFKNLDAGINFYPFKTNRWIYLGIAGTYSNLNFKLEGEDSPNLIGRNTRFVGGGVNTGLVIPLGKKVSIGGYTGVKYLRSMEGLEDLVQVTVGGKLAFNF